MMKQIARAAALAALLATSAGTLAQTNIDASSKFSWSENCGWMNWRDAGFPAGSQGARLAGGFASGFVWMENTGWVNLGNGSPLNGAAYANTTGADFGLNINTDTGDLSGLAWGENIGWINFSLPSLPVAERPRIDFTENPPRLRGYAWGENIGWINLDSAERGKFVALRVCAADFNRDGEVNGDDLADYINCYFSVPPCPEAEFNGDGDINPDDLGDFINVFFGGAC